MKIGIDLGGTKTEAILIDNNGKELSRKRIATEKNYQGTLKGIKFLGAEFENKFGLVESVGIGMPGAISADSSLVKNANSIWLNGKPLRKDLENQLDKKIYLEILHLNLKLSMTKQSLKIKLSLMPFKHQMMMMMIYSFYLLV